MHRVPDSADLLCLWDHDPAVRLPLTSAISSDGGETWSHIRNVDEGPTSGYAYPSILFHEGVVYTTYYHNDGRFLHLKLKALPIRWFYGE